MRVQLLADFYGDNCTKTLIYAIVGLFWGKQLYNAGF